MQHHPSSVAPAAHPSAAPDPYYASAPMQPLHQQSPGILEIALVFEEHFYILDLWLKFFFMVSDMIC